jgi:hypothetical protein
MSPRAHLSNPMRGMVRWLDTETIGVPPLESAAKTWYLRVEWKDLEPTMDAYVVDAISDVLEAAKTAGAVVLVHVIAMGTTGRAVPDYLAGVGSTVGSLFLPDWNHATFLNRAAALMDYLRDTVLSSFYPAFGGIVLGLYGRMAPGICQASLGALWPRQRPSRR